MQTMRRRHDARYGVEPGLFRLRRELAFLRRRPIIELALIEACAIGGSKCVKLFNNNLGLPVAYG
jgi:hypothetical protein